MKQRWGDQHVVKRHYRHRLGRKDEGIYLGDLSPRREQDKPLSLIGVCQARSHGINCEPGLAAIATWSSGSGQQNDEGFVLLPIPPPSTLYTHPPPSIPPPPPTPTTHPSAVCHASSPSFHIIVLHHPTQPHPFRPSPLSSRRTCLITISKLFFTAVPVP